MKTALVLAIRSFTVILLFTTASFGLMPAAHAGLTVNVALYHDTIGYYFYPYLNEDTNPPFLPDGTYYVNSPQVPTNGSQLIFYETNNTLSGVSGGGNYYYDFDSFVYGITNGQWSILFTNSVATNQYFFTVSVSGIVSNSYGAPVTAVFPASNEAFVTNQPLFQWTGPANWAGSLYVEDDLIDTNGYDDYEASAGLSPDQTSWQSPTVLPDGTNVLYVQYSSNVTAFVVASIPTNLADQAISAWTSTATIQTEFAYPPQFTIGPPPALAGGHTLLAHYTFDDSGDPGLDASGNNNNELGEELWGPLYSFSTDAEVGGGAMQFVGTSALHLYGQTLPNIENALIGSFTFSAWVNTTNSQGDDTDDAINGATIFWAYNDRSNTNDVIPLSITGSKAAFTTRDDSGNSTTLHSLTSVNDGNYHLITVTRDQPSGAMRMYVDGNLEAITIGTTEPLDANTNAYNLLSVGGQPESAYTGLLDDLQIYTGALSDSEVAELYNDPGTSVSNISALSGEFNDALGTTGLNWDTSGDSDWFVETTNTFNGLPAAAQSGSIMDYQSSTITLTVNGPGTLTFDWSSIANDPNQGFDLEFDIDGGYQDDIYGDTSWYQDGPFTIPAGQHTLTWTAYANGDTDPTEAAFLDQVTYTPANLPVITLNPFSQTNYPGYQVWLAASATNTPGVTWQWYKVGSGAIAGATSNDFIPTNSGTAGVQGTYYATATTAVGSVDTSRATVTFVSAPLPPAWTTAFKSPFANDYNQFEDFYVTCVPDSLGNVYAAGDFSGTNMSGPPNYISPNGTSADLIKQSATGSMLWTVDITNNGSGFSQSYGVALAPAGGVYVVGNYVGTNWLGTNILANLSQAQNPGDSIFLARFDANGNNLWIRTISGTNTSYVQFNDLVSDAAGNVTLSGGCSGATFFSSTNLATGTNLFAVSPQGVLAQYDLNGTLRWAEVTSNYINSMAESANRIYGTIGNPSTSFNFDGIGVSTDRAKSVVALSATNGRAFWVQGVGEPYGEPNPLNAVDLPLVAVSGTNVFIAGTGVGSNAAFGPYTASWPGLANQFLARCDTNGTPLFITNFGSSTTFPRDMVADANGEVYVDGEFDSYSIFGSDQLAAPIADRSDQFSQAFLAKFDVNGNPLWANEAVATGFVVFVGIGLDANGVWACGVSQSGYYPQLEPTLFGTNQVYSDGFYVSGGEGGGTAVFWQPAGVLAKIDDFVAVAQPVKLLTLQDSGTTFQFSFTSQNGFMHTVLYTTNLLTGSWQTYTNVAGDGTLKTIPVPLSLFSPAHQGFIRVSTQ
jgi:hypothetical protein